MLLTICIPIEGEIFGSGSYHHKNMVNRGFKFNHYNIVVITNLVTYLFQATPYRAPKTFCFDTWVSTQSDTST
jgi:hypothetical protein